MEEGRSVLKKGLESRRTGLGEVLGNLSYERLTLERQRRQIERRIDEIDSQVRTIEGSLEEIERVSREAETDRVLREAAGRPEDLGRDDPEGGDVTVEK